MLEQSTFAAGGRVLAVRCAGELHRQQLRRSLLRAEAKPDLELDLWDPDEARESAPSAVPREGLAVGENELRYAGPEFDVTLDRMTGRGTGWVRAARVEPWHALRPWQALLVSALADLGVETLHAAMVSRDGVGVLLPAPNGHGKSSAALACVAAGMDCLGDDAVPVEPDGDRPTGHTLHAVAKLSSAGLAALPELLEASEPYEDPAEDERAVRLAELRPQRTAPSARIAALAFPRLADGARSEARPLRPAQAASELLRNALSVTPERVEAVFTALTGIAAGVPAYSLEVGSDPAGVAAAVEELL
jgi:hypothetical protein